MKIKNLSVQILGLGLLAGSALAQTPSAPAPKPTTTTKPAATTPAKPAVTKPTPAMNKPASQTVTSKTPAPTKAAPKMTAPVSAKAKPAPSPMAPKKAEAKIAKPAKSAEKKDAKVVVKTAGRRDPFVSPVRLQEEKMKSTSVCTTGARCLVIDQVVLKGIVKTQSGMIAMVENAAKKQYNLREKDPVFNGSVMKISGDSIVFRETITDNLGHQSAKEVVKRVTAPVI
jgi:Tfp pilus assembly protein PilP